MALCMRRVRFRMAAHQAILDRANAPDNAANRAADREWFLRHQRARIERAAQAEEQRIKPVGWV